MIIGNNNNSFNKSNQLVNKLKKETKKHKPVNNFGFTEDLSHYVHSNPTNEIEMYDKSLAMLKERYNKNLISADEFNKKCNEIGKKKAAALNKNNRF